MTSPPSIAARARALVSELGAGPEQEPVVEALLELGVPEPLLRAAAERGRIEDALFDALLVPERAERSVSARQVEQGGGPRVEEVRRLIRAFGLPAPGADEPYFTPAEARALAELGGAADVWPPDAYLQAARVYGQALSRIAATEAHLFRYYVERRLHAESVDPLTALTGVRRAYQQLSPVAEAMLLGIHSRWVEHELAQVAVREAELRSGDGSVPGAVQVALLFCDLKNFTAFAEAEGDAAAVRAIDAFAELVREEVGEAGHLVKELGDGHMLAYPEPAEAVAAGARILARTAGVGGPRAHASVHYGVAIHRDGDYFGRSVNLAARLLDVAAADELLTTPAVAEATSERFTWQGIGPLTIPGLAQPLKAYRLVGPSRGAAGGA